MNKSHPYIFPVLETILDDDLNGFKNYFNKIASHSLNMYFKSATSIVGNTELEKQTIHFANLSNFIALKGGTLKSNQMLSGDMADIFSNLYLAHSVQWYHNEHNVSESLTKYCINRLCNENQEIFNRIIENNKYMKCILFFISKKTKSYNYSDTTNMINELNSNEKLIEYLKQDIVIENTPLEKLCKLSELKEGEEYDKLYNEVIQVGEYKNP